MTKRTGPVAELTDHRLQAVLAGRQTAGRLPSIVAGLVRDGQLVWVGSHSADGVAESDAAGVQYRIGSITKTFTMVLLMQLRNEGRLDLNDRIGDHLPGSGYADLTLRSVLSHSGGMQSEPSGPWWERSPGVGFDELVKANDGSHAPFRPGETYHYSNLGYAMVGEVVARLRESSWWECCSTRILAPLGMRRTSYLPEPPAATGYSVHHFAGTLTEEPATDTLAMAPAGQLWSTVSDLAAYAVFLIDGHPDVLPLESLLEASTPQSGSLAGGAAGGYGLGLRLIPGGSGTLVGHTGSMPGFLATLFVDRVRRTGAVALANATTGMDTEPLARELLATLEECEPTIPRPWRPATTVPAPAAAVLGVWHWGNTAYAFGYKPPLTDADGRGEVVVRHVQSGEVSQRFRVRDDDTLVGGAGYHHGETLHVRRRPDGSVSHLECATFVYTRIPYDPDAPIPGGHPG